MRAGCQTTLRARAELSGVGVHSGLPVNVVLHPAGAGTGVVFQVNAPNHPEREVRVAPGAVVATDLATVLGNVHGPVISTVEHILAALQGLCVDNVIIEVDGPEMPIMDGSAAPFIAAIDAAGVVSLPATRRYLRVLEPIGVVSGASYGELRPYDHGLRLEIEIDFAHPAIGKQSLAVDVDPVTFRRRIARARTFGFMRDVERLWGAGFAFGASLENTLVVGEDRVLNQSGLRFADEFVCHKALDAMGDLALLGAPILAAYRSIRGGHRLNYAVVSALMAQRDAWEMVDAPMPVSETPAVRRMPLYGDRRGLAQAALAPDLT